VTTSRPARARRRRTAASEDSSPKTTRPEAVERREPERVLSSAERIGRNLDAVPDRVDARDYVFQPRLSHLPDELVNCAAVPEILDQGQEGACTGFALAAVINFLLRQRGRTGERVSPRMLYEMARRYDEWPGEEYVGSSARGAMKGWVKHGVCGRASWQDDQQGLGFFTTEVGVESMRTPGGAFYRVVHRDVRDMHAALAEVGILYVTLMVHDGWGDPGPMRTTIKYVDSAGTRRELDLPIIQRHGRADSGHAVAIVGYTHEGFIIQNSWGPSWGAGGFALLPYEDYMLHATDVWVAQLGVPVQVDLWRQGAADSTEGLQRATPAIPLAEIRPYVVDVGNNGELSTSGEYWTTTADIERLFFEQIPRATQGWAKKRVLLYLHGGLNDETTVARRIVGFRDVLLANEIYPLHIMWETDFVETLNNIIRDFVTDVDERAGDWLSRFREGLIEARDRTLELTVAAAGTVVWNEMKENARLASRHPDGVGAMQLLVKHALAAIGQLEGRARDAWELHVVGHSAGCIFTSHAVSELCGLGVAFKTLQFMAPAIRVDEFKSAFLGPIADGVCPRPTLYILSDVGERDDEVGPYGKSLLYLVSNAFEGRRETPLLGMEKYLTRDPELDALFGPPIDGLPAVVVSGLDQGPGSLSRSNTHGGFDNDPDTLNSVLHRILGSPPPRPFTTRDLQY
jgi:Papain family cysteine protease